MNIRFVDTSAIPYVLPAFLNGRWVIRVVFGVHLGPPWLMIEPIPSRVRPLASWHSALCRRAGGARQEEGSASVFWSASASSLSLTADVTGREGTKKPSRSGRPSRWLAMRLSLGDQRGAQPPNGHGPPSRRASGRLL